jgi:hypothetical protein
MTLRLRRTLFIATATLLLAAPLRLAAQAAEPAYAPIDPDLPKPGPVITEVFGTWTPLLGNALLVAEAPVPTSAAPEALDAPPPAATD